MRLAEQIKDYLKCPQTGSEDYRKWGALTLEQRIIINKLCDQCLMFEETADKFGKENIQLKDELKVLKLALNNAAEMLSMESGRTTRKQEYNSLIESAKIQIEKGKFKN